LNQTEIPNRVAAAAAVVVVTFVVVVGHYYVRVGLKAISSNWKFLALNRS